ncbi:MAG TPA: gliding motility-associated ABC transporter substrate-binding protein GldG [Bacteroidia bacterium]|jgi:ABC-2 type transport system permease protein
MSNKRNKKRDLISLILVLAILVMLNFVGSFVFHRFDLTSEKRYTLSDATKSLLANLDDVIYVKVYLEGDFPAGFKRLRNETKEMLDEFRAYSDNNIEYEFINPSANTDKKQQNEVFKQLFEKGLQPTNLEVKEEGGTSQQIIFPGAIVSFRGHELPWQLLKTQMGRSPEAQLNNSIQSLEYEFASCIRNLSVSDRPVVGFIDGHGELDTLGVQDIADELSEFYAVKRVKLDSQLTALKGLDAIIVAKPDTAFTDKEKFILDQFIMKGGKALWLIDPMYTSPDSLRMNGGTLALPYELRLDDLFFKYGVRINTDLVEDIQSSVIPVNAAMRGQPANIQMKPWIFSPLIMPVNEHPIVKNLDVIKMDFVSSIDTIAVKGIRKTILLQSSRYSRTQLSPVRVDLRMVNMPLDEKRFNNPYRNLAVLLEGEFESVFRNHLDPKIAKDSAIGFKEKGVATKMIVISDGDVIRNDIDYRSQKKLPLGYDKYTNQTYGNKNFILNCMNYLCDDSGLISVRARELTLRLLDKKKLKNERLKWQIINTVLPLLALVLFGVIYTIRRKRKYSS